MIELIIIALIMGYREVQILIDRGSWLAFHHLDVFWYTDQDSKKKDLDSFHISNGIITYLIIRLAELPDFIGYELSDIIYWFAFFYIRNLVLHIILKRKGYREWWYIIPIIGKLFKPLFRK